MDTFRVRSYDNGEVRWIELVGDARPTLCTRITRDVAAVFDHDAAQSAPPHTFVLDISGVRLDPSTLDAVLDGVPPACKLALIPPDEMGWYGGLAHRHAISADIYMNQHHALRALGLATYGLLRERPDEARRHPRIETAFRSRVWFEAPRGARFGQAFVANLSRRGACLTRIDMDVARDELSLLASGTQPLHLDIAIGGAQGKVLGRVVRAGGGLSRLGVFFEQVESPLDHALAMFIAERAPEAQEAEQA